MMAKLRSVLFIVLLLASVLLVLKFYQEQKSYPESSPIGSDIRNSSQSETGINTPSSHQKRIPEAKSKKDKPKVKRPTKPIIKQFSQVWKKHGKIFYREIVPNGVAKLDILLLHGRKFTSAIWVNLTTMDILAAAGFRVVAMDLPGFGKSNYKLTDKTDKDLGKFLGTFIKKTKLVSPVIVSPSASGIYSLPYIIEERKTKKVGGFIAIAIVATDRYPQKDFKYFTAPTLIMRGSSDNSLGKRSMDTLRQAIPHSTTKIIEGAGHACYIDNPKAFHESLLEFVSAVVLKNTKRVKHQR